MAEKVGVISPFSATFSLPLNIAEDDARAMGTTPAADSDLRVFFGFVGWTILYCTRADSGDDAVVSGAVARGGLIAERSRLSRLYRVRPSLAGS